MKNPYFLLSCMLITLFGLTATAQKTVTVTTNEPSGLQVMNPQTYQPIEWDGNSLTATVPVGYGLQMQPSGNFEIKKVLINGNDKGTQNYFSYSDFNDGDTFTVTMNEKQPKVLVIKGDADQVYVSSDYTEYRKDKQTDGKWTIPITNEYGTTYIYANTGFSLKSVTDEKGTSYLNYGNCSIYHGSLPSGTTEITVESYNKDEARTASFSVEVTGDASVVSLRRNGENDDVPASQFSNIKFNPDTELPVSISHAQYGKSLYKVYIGEEEQTPQGTTYRLSNITNGCVVKIETDYPDIDVPVKFVFTNEGTEGAVSTVRIDGQPLETGAWLATDFKVKLGKQVSFELNNNDYTVNSYAVNGQSYLTNFIVTNEDGYSITVDANKLEPYKLSVITAEWEHVVIGKAYSNPFESLPLNDAETVLDIPRSWNSIEIKAADGWRIDHVYEAGTENELGISFSLSGDKSIEIYASEYKREKKAVVYFEESDWVYKNITLNPSDNTLRKDITPENGYNFIDYNEADRPFSVNFYHQSFSNPVVYLNGEKIENEYGRYPALETMPENSVIKVFTTEPESHNVTYTINNDVNAQIAHDYLTVVDNPTIHSVQHGTHIVITPVSREGIAVKANDKEVAADAEGRFIVPVTEDTAISIAGKGTVSVSELDADGSTTLNVFNLQGIRVLENASRESLTNLPAGVYIINGKKVIKK